MESGIHKVAIIKYGQQQSKDVEDTLAVEEPLEISIAYKQNAVLQFKIIAVTMRTPGHDEALAIGFLFTENIIQAHAQVENIEQKGHNKICVFLKEGFQFYLKNIERNFYTTSSCGVCGKASIESINTIVAQNIYPQQISVHISTLLQLKEKLNKYQSVFAQTGGIHAAALCNFEGDIIDVKEDVGRHNALDKLIGARLKNNLLFGESILLLSGRASFELIQKAAMAAIPIVCAIGAPSSLAVQLAEEMDITLVGFLKNESCNIYCGKERLLF
jgi:FdhD protein